MNPYPFYYYRVGGPGLLRDPDPNWGRFLDLFGRNRLKAQLTLYPGKPNSPSWCHYQDERTGPFSDGPGRIGWSIGGEKRLVMTADGLEIWDNQNRLQTFVSGTDFFATAVGTTFAGAAVKADQTSGAITNQTVDLAGGSDLACGVSVGAGVADDILQVRTSGLLTLRDWTAVVGTATLEAPEYYLGSSGAWTTTPGTQRIASRIGPLTARIRC